MRQSDETVSIVAGEKVEIYSRSHSKLPLTIELTAVAKKQQPLKGHVELKNRGWIGNVCDEVRVLEAHNRLEIGMWNNIVQVFIKAECDMEVSLAKRHASKFSPMVRFVSLLLIMASVLFIISR